MPATLTRAVWLSATLALAGCAGPAPGPPVAQLTPEQLRNATYRVQLAGDLPVKLTDGRAIGVATRDPATKLDLVLTGPMAFGDLNGDGVPDAAVVLVADLGATRTRVFVAAVLNDHGQPAHASSIDLGDRVFVRKLSIERGAIVVDAAQGDPKAPRERSTVDGTPQAAPGRGAHLALAR